MSEIARLPDTTTGDHRFRVLSLARTRVAALAAYLGPYRYSTAALIDPVVCRLSAFLLIPPTTVGAAGVLIGPLAAVLWCLETEHATTWGNALALRGWLGLAVGLLLFLTGFTCRLTLFSAFELRMAKRSLLVIGHALASVSLFGLASHWANALDAISLAWSLLAGYCGWRLAEQYLYSVRNEQLELR